MNEKKNSVEESKKTDEKSGVVPDPKEAQNSQKKEAQLTETQIYQNLYQDKKKFKDYDVYIFECMSCQMLIMLHQKACPHCQKKNRYFDETLKVSEPIHEEVSKLLMKYNTQLNKVPLNSSKASSDREVNEKLADLNLSKSDS